jgi:hypothetical protein
LVLKNGSLGFRVLALMVKKCNMNKLFGKEVWRV